MRIIRRTLAVLLPLALVTAACAAGDGTGPDGTDPSATTSTTGAAPPGSADVQYARAEVDRATVTDVTGEELAAVVAGNTAFAFDLFHAAASVDGNLLLSPYSVAAALTMTYAGARGDTAGEMRDVLHLGLGDGRIHAARNELDLRITTEPGSSPDDDREPFTIRIANSLWGQQGYPFLEEFLTELARNYDAGMNLVDFADAAEEARRTINAWVEEQTEGRIVDLIPQGAITGLTRLVLVNAIWFKANWQTPFDPERTMDGTFATQAGDVTVPMMHGGGRMAYGEGDGYATVRIPYAGDASMLIVLPDPGRSSDVFTGFGPEELDAVAAAESTHQVDLTMPRFEFRTDLGLKDALQDLGMVAAFAEPSLPGGADLTGMSERGELFVHDVVHQAFISVDEQGTEAAAATAVVVGLESAPPPATVVLDRPFLFLIQHDTTGEILFLGRVTDPS